MLSKVKIHKVWLNPVWLLGTFWGFSLTPPWWRVWRYCTCKSAERLLVKLTAAISVHLINVAPMSRRKEQGDNFPTPHPSQTGSLFITSLKLKLDNLSSFFQRTIGIWQHSEGSSTSICVSVCVCVCVWASHLMPTSHQLTHTLGSLCYS